MTSATNTNESATNFGSSAFRLTPRQWAFVSVVVVVLAQLVSPTWKRLERFQRHVDYRLPYTQSKDYWLYQRHLEAGLQTDRKNHIFVVGDSVMWGEYVASSGTLSHFLTHHGGGQHQFVNAGVNGQFPLALEGLMRYYGKSLRGTKVLLHCNLLWMSSPEADLSTTKEQVFNHATLVPQFHPRILCYRAPRADRIGISIRRQLTVFAWTQHLRYSFFDGQSIPVWTLQTKPQSNAYRNPIAAVMEQIRSENQAVQDSQRGPLSERHRAWYERGLKEQSFDWVPPNQSLQWAAFQRLCRLLTSRGNDVLVVVGPFNAAMVDDASQSGYANWRSTVQAWLAAQGVNHILPETLPSEQYGDASHPLTEGYDELAQSLLREPEFRNWIALD